MFTNFINLVLIGELKIISLIFLLFSQLIFCLISSKLIPSLEDKIWNFLIKPEFTSCLGIYFIFVISLISLNSNKRYELGIDLSHLVCHIELWSSRRFFTESLDLFISSELAKTDKSLERILLLSLFLNQILKPLDEACILLGLEVLVICNFKCLILVFLSK